MQKQRSYVLRCLPVRTGERVVWRFDVQAAEADASRHAFATLADLTAYLAADLDRLPRTERSA